MKKEIIKLEIESLLLKIKDNQLRNEYASKELGFNSSLSIINKRYQDKIDELINEFKKLDNEKIN